MNSRQSKFIAWINYRVRVIIQDSRMLVGTLLAFDKHMNLVLADTEEYTRIKAKKEGEVDKEKKRSLGLIILRGENIVSFSAESPPSQNSDTFETKKELEGKSIPIGRGNIVDQQKNPQMPNLMAGRGMPIPNQMMMQGIIRPPMMNPMGLIRPPMMNNINGVNNTNNINFPQPNIPNFQQPQPKN